MKNLNEFLLSRINGMNSEKFNAECSPDLLMTAMGHNCIKQVGIQKHYRVVNKESKKEYCFTVDTTKNTWRGGSKRGKATDLLAHLDFNLENGDDNCVGKTYLLNALYKDLLRFDYRIKTSDDPIEVSKLMHINMSISHPETIALLARHGISMKTAALTSLSEIVISSSQGRKAQYFFGIPNDNGGTAVFDGKEIRTFLVNGITTLPSKSTTLFYNVFENIMDYLAFQELESRKNWSKSSITCSIILNGESNIDDALKFFRDREGVQPIQCYFPNDRRGKDLYRILARGTGRKLVHDMSDTFSPYRSLCEAVRTEIPQSVMMELENWKESA